MEENNEQTVLHTAEETPPGELVAGAALGASAVTSAHIDALNERLGAIHTDIGAVNARLEHVETELTAHSTLHHTQEQERGATAGAETTAEEGAELIIEPVKDTVQTGAKVEKKTLGRRGKRKR